MQVFIELLLVVFLELSLMLVAHGDVMPSAPPLSIQQTIQQAIQTNLTTKLAKAASQEARGRVFQAAAYLLPQVTGSVSQSRTFKTNLAAIGFTGGFLPNPVIGP